MTAMPINDVVIWQKCAGIYGTYKYTTLDEIVNDTACLGTLFNNISANSYLSRSEILFDSLIANETTLAIMGNNQLIRDTIATNEMLSNKIGTLAEALQLKVFKHRSALYNSSTDTHTTEYDRYIFSNGDSAECSTNAWEYYGATLYNGVLEENAFSSKYNGEKPIYFYYTFATPFILKRIKYGVLTNGGYTYLAVKFTIQGKNADGSWTDLAIGITPNAVSTYSTVNISVNTSAFTEYRIALTDYNIKNSGGSRIACSEIQWYGVRLGLKD